MTTLPHPSNVIGEPEHKAKWTERMVALGHSEKDAAWVYDEALDIQRSPYRFPKFVDALNANIGRLDGAKTMPEPNDVKGWNR